MKLAQTREARALAVAAVARGLIEPNALWDMACRWALGGASTPQELFEGILSPEQISALLGPEGRGPSSARDLAPQPDDPDALRFDTQRDTDPPGEEALPDFPALSTSGARAVTGGGRYEVGEALGAGGAGKVVKARDREIGRVVALKTLKPGAEADSVVGNRFLTEARITAQLEHPNIIPVYDLGTLPSGQPYYSMRVVKRQSLQNVLTSPELRKQWPLVRLIGAFVQISRALAYAHRRGVAHRDIKPENVLLGDYGEVYLGDWGNAKLLSRAEVTEPISLDPGGGQDFGRKRREALASALSGTPGYIAPEQIRGDHARIDQRADIFALGVVLYEILTGEHPFDAPTVLAVILATQTRDPKPPRSISPSCPLLLEDLCLAMLSKDPDRRPPTADRVAAEAEAFLEGAKERMRRREEAIKLCELAKAPLERDRRLDGERERLVEEARRLLKDVKAYEPIERKRAGWELEDRAAEVEREQARAAAEAIDLYTKALAYDPDLVEARAGLADLYWSRAVRADQEHQHAARIYHEALVAEFDVGRYAALLSADAVVSVDSSPPGASVVAYRYVERDRILVASDERPLGRTPLREVHLSPGSYLLVLKRAGYRDVRYPLLLKRGTHHRVEVNLYTDAEIGDGFVYIPGGAFIAGGDAQAYDPLRRAELDVPDFAIAKFPVTFREYCEFLNELETRDLDLALKRAPHGTRGSEGYVARPAAGGGWEPLPTVVEGDAQKLFPAEEGHLWNLPVVLIDWYDAVAYCRFRSERDGIELRLPTELEWEKAARGTDGRFYPWGDHFDPTFCLMRSSRPFLSQPEPVGTFPIDTSPYGVRDMAGGVREWVADVHGERSWAETSRELELSVDAGGDAPPWRISRAGSWAADAQQCRSASRARSFGVARALNLSFRLAKPLSRGPGR
ncbi:protein kinase [Sorangium cellulosum]|uniref:Protein kinase n=1 Tax=Sorangium cellulosum TaxID=56 RepID=A0A4P2Q8S6_SORCE|nr:bifunctional serine/threonine-protein kinase/formylglycine-generating enzyme family protein [Sorangium cellulosum]AUX25920.1 protein kinase [Sorangium cellulosum]